MHCCVLCLLSAYACACAYGCVLLVTCRLLFHLYCNDAINLDIETRSTVFNDVIALPIVGIEKLWFNEQLVRVCGLAFYFSGSTL